MLSGKSGTFLFGLILMGAAIPVLGTVGPRLEAALHPVLTEVNTSFERTGLVVTTTTRFDKQRRCTVELAVVDFKPEIGAARPVTWTQPFNRANGGPSVLERDYQLPEPGLTPGTLRRILYYRCHPFWLTPKVFAPLAVP